MKVSTYQDCYMHYDRERQTLVIGNQLIERKWHIIDGSLYSGYILNKVTGKQWRGNEEVHTFKIGYLDKVSYHMDITSHKVQSEDREGYLRVIATLSQQEMDDYIEWMIYPQSPFITSRITIKNRKQNVLIEKEDAMKYNGIEMNYQGTNDELIEDTIDCIGFNQPHLKVTSYTLYDVTDAHNTLIKKEEDNVYYKLNAATHRYNGNVFLVNSYLEDEGLIAIREAPMAYAAQNKTVEDFVIIPGSKLMVTGSSINGPTSVKDEYIPCYGVTIGVGIPQELCSLYKKRYLAEWKKKDQPFFAMSNTWGDRSQDSAICEDFIRQEIHRASELGIDTVQIDDGWQKGITANSALASDGVWEGYYAVDPNFWDINKNKFPNGFDNIIAYARDKHVDIGLWFSPDSSRDFCNWERDAEVILCYYQRYGIRYYKLDGIKVRNKQCEINLLKLFNKTENESKGQITLNLDITAEERFGYIYEKQHGTLFVENRYTDFRSYYPHYTLRNIWQLAEILPPQRLQMELLNNNRNQHIYDNDPLAPHHYSMDYLFAITMITNPLFWMELSSLTEQEVMILQKIVEVWKNVKEDIMHGEIIPIGQIPDGTSYTGFQIVVNEDRGYLLLFKELTELEEYIYTLRGAKGRIYTEIIYTNKDEKQIIVSDVIGKKSECYIKMASSPRTFAFINYQWK